MEAIIINHENNAIRAFQQLSPEEQQLVEAKKKSINYKNAVEIIQFGAEDANELSIFSSDLFKGFRISDFDECYSTMETAIWIGNFCFPYQEFCLCSTECKNCNRGNLSQKWIDVK